MQIRKAEENDFDAVRNFYHSMIDAMEGTPFHPKWQKDIYPSRSDLKTAIDEQSMYIGVLGDKIAIYIHIVEIAITPQALQIDVEPVPLRLDFQCPVAHDSAKTLILYYFYEIYGTIACTKDVYAYFHNHIHNRSRSHSHNRSHNHIRNYVSVRWLR